MSRPHARLFLSALCGILLVPVLFALSAPQDRPVITREQIEADWLRQDELRRAAARTPAAKVTTAQDAAGGVDGKINGLWGFHTANEPKPWWQVDLGQSTPLDRIVLYNRCDSGMHTRNSRILVLLSADGRAFRKAYQHDGRPFLGHPDKKPLVIKLDGLEARFVRLQLPIKSYFHLDEVEVYAAGGDRNIALHRPATQSSVSQWSAAPAKTSSSQRRSSFPTANVLQRGLRLAESLKRLGADVASGEERLRKTAARLERLPSDAPGRELYMEARWTVRELALSNPLLDFDEILFVKRAPGMFPHVCDQYYGWWSRGGGGIYVLSGFKGDRPALRCLTDGFEKGCFLRPDLSYDGTKVLFAYCRHYPHVAGVRDKTRKDELPEDAFYHIYEMNVDGTGVRRLTRGHYDDFDARYLPDGDIVFLSTRKGTALQVGRDSAAATRATTLPDSYVRCGGGNHRPVAVFTLHRMEGDGSKLRAISAFENFEWTPAVANDGQILYARWDYIDRFNGHFMSLWSTQPDGRNGRLVYGNYTKKPQCVFEARPIPGSNRLVFTATAHHSITGGSLVLLDPGRGTEFDHPIVRLTPEVCFPETEGWPASYYGGPWPLSEEHFLCTWADKQLPKHRLMKPDDPNNPRNAAGLYLFDAFGNLDLLYRDPKISCATPIPIAPRPKPPVLPEQTEWEGPQEGRFLLQDVMRGMEGTAKGEITRLRIIGVLPKVQPQMNVPPLGVSREETGKFVLGTVPVEADGSAHFRVPSGISVFFQALDRDGLAVQTMRSLTYVQPGQTLSCAGCHESRDSAPPAGRIPLAASREPSRILPDPAGTWPLRYDELVQPVLDRHCVSCHKPGSEEPRAARPDLTSAKSYAALLTYANKDLHNLVFEKDSSKVGDCAARRSKLMALLMAPEGHEGVRLDAESRYRLAVWMDTYAQTQGAFSKRQEKELLEFRRRMEPLLASRAE